MTLGTFDGRGDAQYVEYCRRRLRIAQGMPVDPLTRNIDAEHIAETGISLAERAHYDSALALAIGKAIHARTAN